MYAILPHSLLLQRTRLFYSKYLSTLSATLNAACLRVFFLSMGYLSCVDFNSCDISFIMSVYGIYFVS